MKSSVMQKIKRFFTYDWQKKLLSLLAATALWLYFFVTDFEEQLVSIPLHFEGLPASMVVLSQSDENATLKIRGRSIYFNEVNLAEVASPTVYLSNAVLGEANYPIELVNTNSANKLSIKLEKEDVRIALDEVMEKSAVVTVFLTGSPVTGYVVEDIYQSMDTVTLIGPSSILSNVTSVDTQPIDIGTSTNLRYTNVALNIPDQTEVVGNSSLIVSINVTEKRQNEEVVVAVTLVNLDSDFIPVRTPEISLIVDIPERYASYYEDLITVEADCSTVTGSGRYLLPLSVDTAGGITVVSSSVEYVSVQFSENSE